MIKPKHFPNFSLSLEQAMEAKGISPAELARMMGTQPSSVSRWLSGSIPHRTTLAKLRKILDLREEPETTVLREEGFTYQFTPKAPPQSVSDAAATAVEALTAKMEPDTVLATIEKLQSDPTPENLNASRLLTSALRKHLKL